MYANSYGRDDPLKLPLKYGFKYDFDSYPHFEHCVHKYKHSRVSTMRFRTDLFQRAILMSGSALSDWALVKNPILNTIQVGQSLNCGPGGNEKFFDCLRRKRFTDLVSTKMYLPPFVTVFGPMVDGVMITNEPLPLLKEHKNLMSKYVRVTRTRNQSSNALRLIFQLQNTGRRDGVRKLSPVGQHIAGTRNVRKRTAQSVVGLHEGEVRGKK